MRSEERLTFRSTCGHLAAMTAGAAMIALSLRHAPADEKSKADQLLSAPVKLLPTQDAQPQQPGEAMLQQQQRPQPTLPGGKLPQYQLGQDRGATPSAEQLRNPHMTFILALPSQPILVRAEITIDGRPFSMARESRIEQILAAAAQPAIEPEPSAGNSDAGPTVEAPEGDGDEPPAAEPTVSAYTPASSAAERVRRYVTATGREASANEVRWLLTSRIDGPVLLMLNDNFQRFRADQRPVFHVLDRDRDRVISAEELRRALASFQECDLNRDGIVDYTEIARAARDPRREPADVSAAGKLLWRIDGAASVDLIRASVPVPPRFDANGNGRLDAEELPALQSAEPDLRLAIAFDTADPSRSRIAVTAAGDGLADAIAQARADGNTITLPLGSAWLALSAVQAGGSDQISIGAVNDGYPLLPVIDPNDDGRFTVRELRELGDRLREFDRDGDGQLTTDEAQPTIRVCFGLGPLVHRELAGIRSVNSQQPAPVVSAPSWFVRMDRNKDNDLTNEEFLGTDEQFQSLDADRDGLVSGQEAADFDSRTSSPPQSTRSSSEE